MRLAARRYGDALFDFVQALLKITDVAYLSRERARSTFMEDFRALLEERAPAERRTFDWHDETHDPAGNYVVDCRINGMPSVLGMSPAVVATSIRSSSSSRPSS